MTVQFTINGVAVEAEKGENVIDVAHRNGFDVPSLCHHKAVAPYGACRVCLVEITKGGRKKMTTCCNYEVLDGIEVVTDSEEIHKHRAMVLELILAQAPESGLVQELAWEYGINVSRFKTKEDEGSGKQEGCILCGLCSRTCSEVIGRDALTFSGRGDKRGMGAPYGQGSELCVGCGSCASVCPAQCIEVVDTKDHREIWGRKFDFVACEECGAPVMTKAYKEYAVANRELPEDYYTTCAACKKKKLASHFDRVGS